MKLTRFHTIFLLVLSLACAACPGSVTPPRTRFSGTTSIVSRRGLQSIEVDGPACVIEVQDGKWVRSTPVSSIKKTVLKSDSAPLLPFDDDSSVQITVLPPSPPPAAACDNYKPLDKAPYICMQCGGLSDEERARYADWIPCCP
jgi:hypothetical protein